LLNDVGKTLWHVCDAVNSLGNNQTYTQYYLIPDTLSEKINKLSELRTNDANTKETKKENEKVNKSVINNGTKTYSVNYDNYHSFCIECKAPIDTNQLLYVLAVNDLEEAVERINSYEKEAYVKNESSKRIELLNFLKKVLREKLGSEGRRLCYYIDMEVVNECRSNKNLPEVLKGIESLLKDIYDEFSGWLDRIYNCEYVR
jgi:hypothetical protein